MTHETIRLVLGEECKKDIQALLEPRYDVVTRPPPAPGDLCLIDRRQLPEHHESLESVVDTEHPTFYPIVLFRQRNPTGTVDAPNTETQRLIDDIVTMPIDQRILRRRLDNLLIRRRYSISLSRYHHRRHERFDGLFDAIAEPAVVLDEAGNIVQMNDRFCAVFGTNREATVGCPISSALVTAFDLNQVETGATSPVNEPERAITIEDGDGADRHFKVATRSVLCHGTENTVLILTDVTPLGRQLAALQRQLETI